MAKKEVIAWLDKEPEIDLPLQEADVGFSYEDWFDEGRGIEGVVRTLIGLLKKEDMDDPSKYAGRIAYVLGWVGDESAIEELSTAVECVNPAVRMEALASLGRLGAKDKLNLVQDHLQDTTEDINVRANACIALGGLGLAEARPILEATLKDENNFLRECAEESLKLLDSAST